MISLIIPAYNEEKTIGEIIDRAKKFVDEIIVVDDGSVDNTRKIALKHKAIVISHGKNKGYIEALRTGFRYANGNIFVTIDADGEHDPNDIPKLVKPILEDKADLVLGVREKISFSEKIITWITRIKVNVLDASTGFRAIRREIALKMKLKGKCTCGTFILEAAKLGAQITQIKIKTRKRKYRRSRIKKKHFIQTLIVLKEIF